MPAWPLWPPWDSVDANYAEALQDRNSTSRYVFHARRWPYLMEIESKQASIVVVNYRSRILCIGHHFPRSCMDQTKFCQEASMPLNNPICIYLTTWVGCSVQQSVFPQRSKHIDILGTLSWDLIWSKTIHTSPIPGIQNGADFLTKALNRFEHNAVSNC